MMDPRPIVIAVDFDGTICEHKFPDIGPLIVEPESGMTSIQIIRLLQQMGYKIAIWTCRCEPYLSPMTAFLNSYEFYPDAINSNAVPVIGFGMPKIVADMYFDDRNFPPISWTAVFKTFIEGKFVIEPMLTIDYDPKLLNPNS